MPTPPIGSSGRLPDFAASSENAEDQVRPASSSASGGKRAAPTSGFDASGIPDASKRRKTSGAEEHRSDRAAAPPAAHQGTSASAILDSTGRSGAPDVPPLDLENLDAGIEHQQDPPPPDTPKKLQLLAALRGETGFVGRHRVLAKKYKKTKLKTWGKKRLSQLLAEALSKANKADEIQSPSLNQLITSPLALAEIRTSKALRWLINGGKFLLIPGLPKFQSIPTTTRRSSNIESDMRNGLLITELYTAGLIDADENGELIKGEEIKSNHFDEGKPGINPSHTTMMDSVSLLERDDIVLVDRICGFEKIDAEANNLKRGEIIQAGHLYRLTFGSHDEESIQNGRDLLDNELSFLKANIPKDEILSLGSLCMYAAKAGKIKETAEVLLNAGMITKGVRTFLITHGDELKELRNPPKPQARPPAVGTLVADDDQSSTSSVQSSSSPQSQALPRDENDQRDNSKSQPAPSGAATAATAAAPIAQAPASRPSASNWVIDPYEWGPLAHGSAQAPGRVADAPQVAYSSEAMRQQELEQTNAALKLQVAQLQAAAGSQPSTRPTPPSPSANLDLGEWWLSSPTDLNQNPAPQPAAAADQNKPDLEDELLEEMDRVSKK
jgi:hypothetical protein